MKQITAEHLRSLRDDVAITEVLEALGVPTGRRGRRVTFRCLDCGRHDAVVTEERNFGYCFRCRTRFNTIDLVIAEGSYTFLEAIALLDSLLA